MAPVVFKALRISTVLAAIALCIAVLLVGLVKSAEPESSCSVAPCLPRS